MKNLFNRFVREDAGQDLIECGLLVGVITVGAIVAIQSIGPKVTKFFTDLDGKLSFRRMRAVRPHPPLGRCDRSDGAEDSPRRGQMRIQAQFARAVAARFATDDSEQDLIEYALLTAIIGISGVLILSALSTKMGTAYSGWNTAGQNAWQPCPPQPAACP